MPRVKRGVTARARHKKVIDQAKGYRGRRKNVYKIAKQAVMKAGQYAVPRPPQQEARVQGLVDHPHQRGRPPGRESPTASSWRA
jgi:large subunit ribosomal protein L20